VFIAAGREVAAKVMGMRILIADDNEFVRRGVADMLSNEVNLDVCGEASNGTEALQKSEELRPDLVLLDISMPGISGYETARLLREQAPGIRILIMSFGDTQQLLPLARKAGADDCVDKARLGSDLLTTINRFLPAGSQAQNKKVKRATAGNGGLPGARFESPD
jgi:DNA-binding NarL/FixJ family response regulator